VCCAGTAFRAEAQGNFSPRWMYEIKGGRFEPRLDDYATFYGGDHDTFWAAAGAYRLRDWLEIGVEIGHMRDRGLGRTPSGELIDAVDLRLVPLQIFATYVHQPHADRRWVPYAGVGLAATWYEQDIELEPGRDGRSDLGAAARAGFRWLLGSDGPHVNATRDSIYSRGYIFLEAQRVDTDIDEIDLGGTSYVIGFRAELEMGR